MILECDASIVRPEAKPRFSRSKVGLSEHNGQSYVVVINSRIKEKFAISRVDRLHPATIVFKEPSVNLMIKNADQVMLKLLMKHVQKLQSGHTTLRLPRMDDLKTKKPQPTSLNTIGSNFDRRLLNNKALSKVHLDACTGFFPKQLWELRNLVELRLTGCRLIKVPNQIRLLGQTLKVLDLSHNNLKTIPFHVIRSLRLLTSLCVSFNSIQYLPLEIGVLTELTTLDCRNNCIKVIPFTLLRLNRIRELNFSANQIPHLSSAIWEILANKRTMQQIDLSENLTDRLFFKEHYFPSLFELACSSAFKSFRLIQCMQVRYLPRVWCEYVGRMANLCGRCRSPFIGYRYCQTIKDLSCCGASCTIVTNSQSHMRVFVHLCPICALNDRPSPVQE